MTKVDISKYRPLVKLIVWQITKGYYRDEDDLIQEGLIGVWNAALRYEPCQASFETFASHRIRGRILDFLEKESKHRFCETIENLDFVDTSLSPYEKLEEFEFCKNFQSAISSLSDREKFIFDKIYREEMSAKQVASFIGVSEARVSFINKSICKKLKNTIDQAKEAG